jgi:valyl-tRNA synthetase
MTSVALSGLRKAKSEARLSMRADLAAAVVTGPAAAVAQLRAAADDLRATGRVAALDFVVDGDAPLRVDVTV